MMVWGALTGLRQEPNHHGAKKDRTLPAEANHDSLRVQFQEFLMIKGVGAHSDDMPEIRNWKWATTKVDELT
jgi:hypothetical protein